jgi:hypothetical protein
MNKLVAFGSYVSRRWFGEDRRIMWLWKASTPAKTTDFEVVSRPSPSEGSMGEHLGEPQ